jgi:predicted nucleic-acid-binding protein
MIGLDTNVLVRYLVKDDKKQAERAARFILNAAAEGESCFINTIVLCELVWVLESAYDYQRKEIAAVLEKILLTKQVEVESHDIVRQAVHEYRQGNGDFADYLIGRINYAQDCEHTVTFDRALKGSPAFVMLD